MNYNDQKNKSVENDFLSRSLLENSKSRICYLDLRVKYFDEEIKARDLAREEAKRIDSLEEGDIMEKNNDLKNIVVDSKSSPTVKLTPQEKAKQKALLQKQKEKEKARLAKEKEKQKEKERLAREKQKQKEKERLAREKEKQKEKERLAREKEKQKEKERLAKERAKQKELEKKEREKQKALEKKEASSLNKNVKSLSFETDNVLEEKIKKQPEVEEVIVDNELQEEITENINVEDIKDTNVDVEEEIDDKQTEEDVTEEVYEEEVEETLEEVSDEQTEEKVEEVEEKSAPKSLEELLAMKKKDDSKQVAPSDNISKLRQRMEANRKLDESYIGNKEVNNEEKDSELYKQIAELEKKVQELEEENNNLTDEINDLENEKEKILKEHDKKIEEVHMSYVDEISDLRNEIDNLENDLSKKEPAVDNSELAKLKAIIADQDKTIETLKKENKSLQNKLTKAQETIEDLEDQVADLEDELDELENAEVEAESNAELLKEIEDLKAVVDKLDKLVDDKEEELASKEELIESLNDALNAEKDNAVILTNKLDKSDSEQVVALENKVEELERANEELVKANEEAALENKQLVEKVVALEEQVKELVKAKDEERNKYLQANKKLTTSKNKVKELEKDNKEKQEKIVVLTNSLLEKENEPKDNDEEIKQQCEELTKEINDKNLVIEELTKANEELREIVDNISKEEETLEVFDESLSEEELLAKINDLKKQIEENDDRLVELNSKLDELSEKDIRNPEFTRAILNIRERKQELINKMASDKSAFESQQARNQELLDEATRKYAEVKEKREGLNKQYQNIGESTSLRKEEYLAKSQKITIEEETIIRSINERKADEEIASEKFNNAINECETLIKELNRQEVEIIEFYLNKLKEEYSNSNEDYKEYEKQKKDLMKQLNDLNIVYLQMQVALEQSRSLVRDAKVDEPIITTDASTSKILILKADIAYLTKEYHALINKIDLIKKHLDNRSKSEKVLRITDEDIVKYNAIVTDLDALTLRYQTNEEVMTILNQDLSTLDNEQDVEQITALNNKLEYINIVQSDIQEKINYCKDVKDTLEQNDKVNYYISLLKSMEQLKVKNIEFRVRANDIKDSITLKETELRVLENKDDSEGE